MKYLYITCIAAYLISYKYDRSKTMDSFKMGAKMLIKLTPMFLNLILLMALLLYVIPPAFIAKILNGNQETMGMVLGSLLGSVAVMPGFVVFPLARILAEEGVSYGILAAFTTTLMMVGIITFPLEQRYFGTKIAFIRNVASYGIAIVVSIVIAWVL